MPFPMPGIPPRGTAEWSAFLASFWPAFYSEFLSSTIVALVIGVIVGKLLLRMQNDLETRREHEQHRTQFLAFIQGLRFALAKRPDVQYANPMSCVPVSAEAILLLSNQPIELWRRALVEYSQLFSLIERPQQAYRSFALAAATLNARLEEVVRRYNWDSGIEWYRDRACLYFITARLHGQSTADIVPLLGFSVSQPEAFEDCYNNALSLVERQTIDSCLEAEDTLEKATTCLRTRLATPPYEDA